ncbi:MAG: hypothetical protein WB919_01655 [Candidatus Sulfotelmatobacter sp.]
MENVWALASVWVGLALIATLLAIWFKISTALSEIVVGTVAQLVIGALFVDGDLGPKTSWISFLAGKGAIVLSFLAGAVKRDGLSAPNLGEFLDKIRAFSGGNPGAIVALLKMANYPKYRSNEQINITPLYIDFRMNWNPAKQYAESAGRR